MAGLALNINTNEESTCYFTRSRAIEEWETAMKATKLSYGGGYSCDIGYLENQTLGSERVIDSTPQRNPSGVLRDMLRNIDSCLWDDQSSIKSEHRHLRVEELLPYYLRKNIEEELQKYLDSADGWAGVGSIAVPKPAVENALSFLSRFPRNLLQPTPMAAADGEVGLYWRHQSAYVEVEFAGDGVVFGYGRDLDGNEEFIEDLSIDVGEEMSRGIEVVSKIVAGFSLDND